MIDLPPYDTVRFIVQSSTLCYILIMNNMNKTETIIYWMNTECFNEASNFEKGLNQLNEERHTITLALNQREDQNLSLAAGLLLDLAVESS